MPEGVELATGYVSLIVEGSKVNPEVRRRLGEVQKDASKAGKESGGRFAGSFGKSLRAGAGLFGGFAIGRGVVDFLKDSNAEAREAQKVGALTAQVIKSTGGVAKVSAKHVGDLSTALSNKVGIDDELIQSGENVLLTFKRVHNEVGKGNAIFDRATRASVDLSATPLFNGNITGATKQLGKALNDPVRGITALNRAGVQFTDQQKEQIKTFVKSGKTLKAQKIILHEVESQVGGAAAAQATAGDKAKVAIKNLEEQIGTGLLPVVDDLATFTSTKAVPAISKFVTGMQDGTGAGGDVADVLGDILDVGKGVLKFFDSIPGPVKKYGAEIAIAAVAVGKLNNGLGGLAGRTSLFMGSLRDADTTAKRLQTLGGALRNVAGAGGMLLVADSADEAGTKIGALKAISGGALSGAALGAFAGPPGAAVGAALGGIAGAAFLVAKDIKSTGDSASYAFPKIDQYTDSLGGATAAITAQTRAEVLDRIQKSGLLKDAEALNISDRDAVQAALGNEAARKRVSAALRDAVAQGKNYQALKVAERLGVETTAIRSSRVAQLKKNLALAATKEEAQKIQAKLDRLAKTNANPTVRIGGAAQAISQLTAIQQLLRDTTGKKGGNAQLPKTKSLLGQLTHRASGGPVRAGQGYIVGDRGPRSAWELFVPDRNGQIVPRVSESVARTGAPMSGRIALTITNWDEGTGHMEWIADSRVDAAAAMQGETARAFG